MNLEEITGKLGKYILPIFLFGAVALGSYGCGLPQAPINRKLSRSETRSFHFRYYLNLVNNATKEENDGNFHNSLYLYELALNHVDEFNFPSKIPLIHALRGRAYSRLNKFDKAHKEAEMCFTSVKEFQPILLYVITQRHLFIKDKGDQ